jgi:hypothetical protein
MELADALLENTSVTYLKFVTNEYTKRSAEAMAKYVRTSKRLQRIIWRLEVSVLDPESLQQHKEMLCCFLLPAF